MTENVGTTDRILRALAGGILLVVSVMSLVGAMALSPLGTFALAVVGGVLLATAGIRFCPAYRLFGIQTCKR